MRNTGQDQHKGCLAVTNPFDQFDAPEANPFDQFDDAPAAPVSRLRAAGHSAAHGLSVGLSDEIEGLSEATRMPISALVTPFGGTTAAAIGALLNQKGFKERFQEGANRERAALAASRDQHPLTSFASELASAIVPALATGGGSVVGRGLLGAAGRTAVTGSAAGTVYGVNTGEGGLGARVKNGAVGGVLGGLTGLALPIVGSRVQGLVRSLRSKNKSLDTQATKKLIKLARRQGDKPTMVRQALENASRKGDPEEFIFEALPENFDPVVDAIGTRGGGARVIAKKALKEANDQQADRVLSGVRNVLGDQDFSTSAKKLQSFFQKQGSGQYQDAFKQQVVTTEALEELLQRPAAKKAAVRAGEILKNRGRAVKDVSITEQLHYVKEGLDDQIGTALRKGDGNRARAVIEVKKSLLDEIETQNPAYQKARHAWAGAKADENALQLGRKIFSMDEEDIADFALDYSESERAHFLAGVTRAAKEKIRAPSARNDVTRRLASLGLRDKLRAGVGDDLADDVFQLLDKEEARTVRRAFVNPDTNSRTVSRQEAVKKLEGPRGYVAHAIEDLTGLIGAARRSVADQVRAVPEEELEALARILFSRQGGGAVKFAKPQPLALPNPRTATPAAVGGNLLLAPPSQQP